MHALNPLRRLTAVAIGASILGVGAIAPASIVHPVGAATSPDRPSVCPKKVADMKFDRSIVRIHPDSISSISCYYDNYGKKRGSPNHVSTTVRWYESGSRRTNSEQVQDFFCREGSPEETGRSKGDRYNGADYSNVGERLIVATWFTGQRKTYKRGRKLARGVVKKLRSRAQLCPQAAGLGPDAPSDAAPGRPAQTGRTINIILSGDRLTAMRDAGGVGAEIALTEDEGWGLVVSAADGSEVIREDYLGSRGRVTDIGIVASSSTGEELVAVTVEVLPDPTTDDPDATDGDTGTTDDPDATDGDTGTTDDPADPADPDDTTADTGALDPDAPPDVDPPPDGDTPPDTDVPDDRAGPSIDAVADRVRTGLDDVRTNGSGTIAVSSDEVAAAAALVPESVRSVRVRDGKIEVKPTSGRWPTIFLYPSIEPETGEVSVTVKAEPPGMFSIFEVPVPMIALEKAVPELARQLKDGVEAVNREARERGLRVGGLQLSKDGGIRVDLEAT